MRRDPFQARGLPPREEIGLVNSHAPATQQTHRHLLKWPVLKWQEWEGYLGKEPRGVKSVFGSLATGLFIWGRDLDTEER